MFPCKTRHGLSTFFRCSLQEFERAIDEGAVTQNTLEEIHHATEVPAGDSSNNPNVSIISLY
jgi:hypothetical protein